MYLLLVLQLNKRFNIGKINHGRSHFAHKLHNNHAVLIVVKRVVQYTYGLYDNNACNGYCS
jgi:hypothetical protein